MSTVVVPDGEQSRNRLKFLSFNEQLRHVNVNTLRRVGVALEDEPEDGSSFFQEGLNKWRELNCSADYTEFQKAVAGKGASLSILVLHQNEVVDLLLKFLARPSSLGLEPILDLVAQLARDLRSDLYPRFKDVFHALMAVVNTPGVMVDSATVAQTFLALTYCFKFLRKQLVADIIPFLSYALPALGPTCKAFARQFACESVAFVVRKLATAQHAPVLAQICDVLDQNPSLQLSEAVSMLLFEIVRHVQTQFHSIAPAILPCYLGLLARDTSPDTREATPDDFLVEHLACYTALQQAFHKMAEHTRAPDATVLWDALIAAAKGGLAAWQNKATVASAQILHRQLLLLQALVRHRRGSRLEGLELTEALQALAKELVVARPAFPAPLLDATFDLVAALVQHAREIDARGLLEAALNAGHPPASVQRLLSAGVGAPRHLPLLVPQVLRYCAARLPPATAFPPPAHECVALEMMTLLARLPGAAKPPVAPDGVTKYLKAVQKKLIPVIKALGSTADADAAIRAVWAIFVLCRWLGVAVQAAEILATLEATTSATAEPGRGPLLFLAGELIALIAEVQPATDVALAGTVEAIVIGNPANYHILSSAVKYFQPRLEHVDGAALLSRLIGPLSLTLSNPSSGVRSEALRLLSILPQPKFLPAPAAHENLKDLAKSPIDIFSLMLSIEETPLSVEAARERAMLVARLVSVRYTACMPPEYHLVPYHFFLGCFHVNFSLIEGDVRKALAAHAQAHPARFWTVFQPALADICAQADRVSVIAAHTAAAEEARAALEAPELPDEGAIELALQFRRAAAVPQDRVDVLKVHEVFFAALAHVSGIVEQRNRDVIPVFLRFVEEYYDKVYEGSGRIQDLTGATATELELEGIAELDDKEETDGQANDEGADAAKPAKGKGRGNAPEAAAMDVDDDAGSEDDSGSGSDDDDDADPDDAADDADANASVAAKAVAKESEDEEDEDAQIDDTTDAAEAAGTSKTGTASGPASKGKGAEGRMLSGARKACTRRMRDMLRLLAKFSNPGAVAGADKLLAVYVDLISRSEDSILALAVECLATFKQRHIMPYLQNIKNIVDEKKHSLRNELLAFSLAQDGGVIKHEHRKDLLPVVFRILQTKMSQRQGRSSGLKARRGVVLRFALACAPEEFAMFLQLAALPWQDDSFERATDPRAVVPLRKQLGFLSFASDLIGQLGVGLVPHLDYVLTIVLFILRDAARLLGDRCGITPRHILVLRSIRALALRRLADIFESYPTYDFGKFLDLIYEYAVSPQLTSLRDESLQSSSPLLTLLHVWSRHDELHSLLSGQGDLILPCVFSILSHPDVADTVVQDILAIADNLLPAIDREGDADAEGMMDAAIAPHVSLLLQNMAELLQAEQSVADANKRKKKKERTRTRAVASGRLGLSILSRLSPYATDPEHAAILVGLLVPYLEQERRDVSDSARRMILDTIKNCVRIAPDIGKHYNALCDIYAWLDAPMARTALSQLFEVLAASRPALAALVPVLLGLNAVLRGRADLEPDFDARFTAFAAITPALVQELGIAELRPIVANIVFYCCAEDSAIRSNSFTALLTICQYLARQAGPDGKEPAGREAFDTIAMGPIMQAMRRGMTLESEPVRLEWVLHIGAMARMVPEHPRFADLFAMTNANPDLDVFQNLTHIQRHRRTGALRKIAELAAEGKLSASTCRHLLLPLVSHHVLSIMRVTDHNLLTAAIDSLGAMCATLTWDHYLTVLRRYLRLIVVKPAQERVLVRVIVSILDRFHFPTELPAAVPAGKPTAAQTVHSTVVGKLLPNLYRHLTRKEDDAVVVHTPVALAIVKLLLQLPQATMHHQLPQLLTKVIGVLRDRLQSARDTAQATLVQIAKNLGPFYFKFIVKELGDGLTRGFQRHVLGHATHSLLDALVPSCKMGDLDDSIPNLTPILIEDIFGEVSEEKEVAAIANKLKAAKKNMSFDSFGLVSRVVSPGCIMRIIDPLKEVMRSASTAKASRNIEEVFRFIGIGLAANKGLTVEDNLRFIYGLLSETVSISIKQTAVPSAKTARPESIFVLPAPVVREKTPVVCFETNAHILVCLGLQLLHGLFKHGEMNKTSPEHCSMMVPLIPLLNKALTSKYNRVLTLTLRVLSFFMAWTDVLPQLANVVPVITMRVFKLLQRGGVSDTAVEMMQSCCKVATIIVRDCGSQSLTESQLKVLLAFARQDMDADSSHASLFALCKAIIARKLVIPDIYDIMDRVAELLIQSPQASTREQCRQIFLQFLMDYPIGHKRLEHHLTFLVSNVNYTHDTGRVSVLTLMHAVVTKFPDEVLRKFVDMMFLPLVAAMAGAESSGTREATAHVLKALFGRIAADKLAGYHGMAVVWLGQPQPAMKAAAVQLVGLFAEVMGANYAGLYADARDALAALITAVEEDTGDIGEETGEVQFGSNSWTLLYAALSALTKVVRAIPAELTGFARRAATAADGDLPCSDLWIAVQRHLLHQHSWIRASCSRLFGLAFAPLTSPPALAASCLAVPVVSHTLASALCKQLNSLAVTPALADQILRNLVFLGKVMLQYPAEAADEATNGDEDDDGDGEERGRGRVQGLPWLVRRMAVFVRRELAFAHESTLKRDLALKFYAAMAKAIGTAEGLQPHMHQICSSLYRTMESEKSTDELKDLARQVQEILVGVLGSTAYFAALNGARDAILVVRQGRKRKAAEAAISNPQQFAKARVAKNLKKREGRRKKVDEVRARAHKAPRRAPKADA
eukprot:m.44907 g.44907  ORF g.44907 m.44907 type:complete len:2742 (-) comp5850_c0_seq1:279-8504(-)